jgi:23S rRNA (pseudouridine1915-N3)-methyltransferase
LKSGPEAHLCAEYVARAAQTGRGIGFKGPEVKESEPPGGRDKEAAALLGLSPAGARRIVLDERGDNLNSERLALLLAAWRDQNAPACAFLIGGADGHGAAALAGADQRLSFGAQTWPHRLVRVMLAEQIYRALTILAGSPYHRA